MLQGEGGADHDATARSTDRTGAHAYFRSRSNDDITQHWKDAKTQQGSQNWSGAPPTRFHPSICCGQGCCREQKLSPCPCCGYRTLDQPDIYQLCPVCFWEDDPHQTLQPDSTDGANGFSLIEGRETYRSIVQWHRSFCRRFARQRPTSTKWTD